MLGRLSRRLFRKIVGCLAATLCLFLSLEMVLLPACAQDGGPQEEQTAPEEQTGGFDTAYGSAQRYAAYVEQYADAARNPLVKVLTAGNIDSLDEGFERIEDEGETVLSTADTGAVTYRFTIDKAGLYALSFDYKAVEGRSGNMERRILVDGSVPCAELENIVFKRLWRDVLNADGAFDKDGAGNDIKPSQEQLPAYTTAYAEDSSGMTAEPLHVYLTQGEHTLTIESVREKLLLKSVRLGDYKQPMSYEDYLKAHPGAPVRTDPLTIEAEKPYLKSDISLYPINDKLSASTSPQSPSALLLNTIGSTKWQQAGQWITWRVEVPETGYYRIDLRARQNIKSGVFSSRTLLINGEIPFAEAADIRFNYNENFTYIPLGDGEQVFSIYLEKGEPVELTLKVTLGEMIDIISQVDTTLTELNSLYRSILMITGSSPDKYRDYGFEKMIPEVIEQLGEKGRLLEALAGQIKEIAGEKGDSNAILYKLVYQLQKMSDNPDTIANQFNDFKNNLAALGTWLNGVKEQPLEIDTITLSPADAEQPKAQGGFFHDLWFGIQSFFCSFMVDYNVVTGSGGNAGEPLDVWVATGRDQLMVIRQLVDTDYSKTHSTSVRLQLVTAGSLLPATLAGTGPDISLSNVTGDPINFALRGAAYDLTQFEDYEEVIQRFYPSAVVPYTYRGKAYALPETQSYPMFFYRKDIFASLSLEPPETWDDFISMAAVLQKNNMQVGMMSGNNISPNALSAMLIFLYQNNEELYREDGKYTNLDSDAGLQAFSDLLSLFNDYSFPISFDFPNRFRTGEMPAAIQDYTLYNNLTIFAPEIKGLWEMVPVPGTVQEDGSINNSVPSGGLNSMILTAAEDKETAWEFLKWWTDDNTQSLFAFEMESVLGPAAKYPSANKNAFDWMPWSASEAANIRAQWEVAKGTPEVPGGYMSTRNVDFAFLKTFNEKSNATDTLSEYIKAINDELTRKRKEFRIVE